MFKSNQMHAPSFLAKMYFTPFTENPGLPQWTAHYETFFRISRLVEELRSSPISDNPCQHPLSILHHLAHTSWMPLRVFLTLA